MRSYRKTILIALLVGAVGGYMAVKNTPNISEACHPFFERMQQVVLNDGGLAGLVASVPEQVLDQAMQERYGSMTPEQCTAATPELAAQLEALAHTKWAAQMDAARGAATTAVLQCRDKRINGEIKTHAESAQCSNPAITAAFTQIGYPYMDLVALFTAKRLEQAQKLDKALLSGSEDQLEFARLAIDIAEQERKRVAQTAH